MDVHAPVLTDLAKTPCRPANNPTAIPVLTVVLTLPSDFCPVPGFYGSVSESSIKFFVTLKWPSKTRPLSYTSLGVESFWLTLHQKSSSLSPWSLSLSFYRTIKLLSPVPTTPGVDPSPSSSVLSPTPSRWPDALTDGPLVRHLLLLDNFGLRFYICA